MKGEELREKVGLLLSRLTPYSLHLIILLVAVSLLSVSGCFWYYANNPVNPKYAEVYIPAGSSFKQIEQQLTQAGVIKPDMRFAILARFMGVAHKLQAGEYVFTPQVSPRNILKIMQQGKTISRSFTVAEGLNILQIAEVFKKQDIVNADGFLDLAQNLSFLKKMGIPATSIEGYLFPDTYFFAKGEALADIVVRMVRRMDEVLLEEGAKETASKLSSHDVLTLASIIEKETGIPAERPLVAEVFLNRLQKGMRLQADPTVTYGLSKFDTPLSRKDLKTPTPYNTYTQKGLPVGPICSPGRGSIAAVLHPASSGNYYFVADNNGGHVFSKKLAEHNRAVVQYRKRKNKKR